MDHSTFERVVIHPVPTRTGPLHVVVGCTISPVSPRRVYEVKVGFLDDTDQIQCLDLIKERPKTWFNVFSQLVREARDIWWQPPKHILVFRVLKYPSNNTKHALLVSGHQQTRRRVCQQSAILVREYKLHLELKNLWQCYSIVGELKLHQEVVTHMRREQKGKTKVSWYEPAQGS